MTDNGPLPKNRLIVSLRALLTAPRLANGSLTPSSRPLRLPTGHLLSWPHLSLPEYFPASHSAFSPQPATSPSIPPPPRRPPPPTSSSERIWNTHATPRSQPGAKHGLSRPLLFPRYLLPPPTRIAPLPAFRPTPRPPSRSVSIGASLLAIKHTLDLRLGAPRDRASEERQGHAIDRRGLRGQETSAED